MDLPTNVSPAQPRSQLVRRYQRRCSVTKHSLRVALELFRVCTDNEFDPSSASVATDEGVPLPVDGDGSAAMENAKPHDLRADHKRVAQEDLEAAQEALKLDTAVQGCSKEVTPVGWTESHRVNKKLKTVED